MPGQGSETSHILLLSPPKPTRDSQCTYFKDQETELQKGEECVQSDTSHVPPSANYKV